MSIERFVVDARLLRELGERLVGKPHIALAEVIKNAYDADARVVNVYFSDNCIKVVDDGHGMSHRDFSKRWLTIGTTVKEENRVSPELKRPFTGSKGVGRLSVQLLARELELRTVGLVDPALRGRRARHSATRDQLHSEVVALIDWDSAIRAGYIENVDVEVAEQEPSTTFASGSSCGTELILTTLVSEWDANSFRELARELWPLQPPFDAPEDDESAFHVNLYSPYEDVVREFESQMRAILDIWSARVTGTLLPVGTKPPNNQMIHQLQRPEQSRSDVFEDSEPNGRTRLLRIRIEIRQGVTRILFFRINNCHIDRLSYEIRIFSLQHRQPRGVKLDTARQYLLSYGGVHIYDAKFHLPYYGPDLDWLRIEQDHARRLSASRLLPADLQVRRGMLDLVPNSRIYGAVDISTTHEAEYAALHDVPPDDVLTVQITRDRLVENRAIEELTRLVRTGMDLYAMETARAKFAQAQQRRSNVPRPPSDSLRDTERRLRSLRDTVPSQDREEFAEVERQFAEAVADAQAIENAAATQTGLMAALATAGMTALAYEHEVSKQVADMERIASQISQIASVAPQELRSSLAKLSDQLLALADRTRRIRDIFSALSDEETRTSDDAGSIYSLVRNLVLSLEILSRGTDMNYEKIPRGLNFPRGGYPSWWAILQNIIVNALNATLDTRARKIEVDAGGSSNDGWIRVQDTGTGIDLNDAERMFEPFERGDPISRERAALALGGTGLGLTIVRLVADELGARVAFERPEPGFRTAIRITWRISR